MDGGRVVFSNALLCYIDQVVRKVAIPHREIVHMIGRERFRHPDFPWECFGDGWYHPPAHLRHAAWNGLKGGSEPQVVDQVNLHNLIMSKTKPLQSRKKSKGSIGDLFFAWGRCSVFGKVMSKFFLPKLGNNTRSWKKEKKGARMTQSVCICMNLAEARADVTHMYVSWLHEYRHSKVGERDKMICDPSCRARASMRATAPYHRSTGLSSCQ